LRRRIHPPCAGTDPRYPPFCAQTGCADGFGPYGGLVQAASGVVYGTTFYGGKAGAGTIFQITPAGTLTTLHSFNGADGGEPFGALVQATDRNFYGTTLSGGKAGAGTIFKITYKGALTTLHSFDPIKTKGTASAGALLQATNGNFYGTTSLGGAQDDGTIFSLSAGLGPFIEALPASGKVGVAVQIIGTDLTGTTSVTFNDTAAAFTVDSQTLISATVPAGATGGFVTVNTSTGTLKSNVKFRVIP
jgi:uncharacterized repeat protein (TIGR03803 family)